MKKTKDYYNEILEILARLKKAYPTYTIGQHIDTSLSDYKDVWGLSDREVYFSLRKYESELELDAEGSLDVERIIRDSKNLKNLDVDDEYFDEEDI